MSSSSSCRAASTGYPWPSLATFPYRSLPQAGLLYDIPYPHIVAECMFVLVVLLLHGHVWGSKRVHHLWVRPCFSSSVLHVWVRLTWIVFVIGGRWPYSVCRVGVLPPGLVGDCSQHSCVIANAVSSRQQSHRYCYMDATTSDFN